MDTKAILDNLLETSQRATRKGVEMAESKLNVPESGPERDQMLDGMKKGALAAGAIALLLGTKGGRRLTGTAVKVGGLAAVGGLAYKAFNEWQQGQGGAAPVDTGTPIDQLAEPAANKRSEAIVRAMIMAAKADGHIDANERLVINGQLQSLGLEDDITTFLLNELDTPMNIDTIAASADTPETAAELYLASAMVVDFAQAKEREYLDALAQALNIDSALARKLESEVG
jgi:uncharacterized membrane protein YebE (DUF533 family)